MVFLGLAAVAGGLIGVYWNILALVPATVALVLCWSSVYLTGETTDFPRIILACVSLQGGYMIGLTARSIIEPFLTRGYHGISKRS
jgi:hypothetical protein